MDPRMFEQARKNMNPESIKQATNMMAGMSDDQLRNMAKMTGMNIDPQLLKRNINLMKNMDDNQLNKMKNMASNMSPDEFQKAQQKAQQQFSAPSQQNTQTPQKSEGNYIKIEKLKQKGNDYFKNNDFDNASTAYLEAILEIEEIKMSTKMNDELKNLEISCRLNYATTKSKLNDFEIVLSQAQEVLKYGDNGKAFYRLGLAQYNLKKPSMALKNIEKAVQMMPNDTVVQTLHQEVKKIVDQENLKQAEQKKKEYDQQSELEKEYQKIQEEQRIQNEIKKEKLKQADQTKSVEQSDQKNEKMQEEFQNEQKNIQVKESQQNNSKDEVKKIKKKNVDYDIQEDDVVKHVLRNDSQNEQVIIEDEKSQSHQYFQNENQPQNSPQYPIFPQQQSNVDPEEAIKQLKNMDQDQLQFMTDTFKTMDNNFIKQMMKSQGGINIFLFII